MSLIIVIESFDVSVFKAALKDLSVSFIHLLIRFMYDSIDIYSELPQF